MRLFLKAIPLLFAVLAIFLTACSPKPGSSTPTRPGPQPRPSDDFSWLHVVVPPGWHETAPRQYESADGYAWLELLESDGARLEAACIREANREKPQTYGAYPEIRDAPREDQPACLILPSPDQPTERRQEALFLMQVPPSILPDKVLALHADSAHIESFIAALSFTQPLPTLPAATCDFSVAGQAPHVTQIDDLGDEGFRIDEFPIARGANCSPLNDPEGFHQIIQSGAPARRADDIYETQFQGERRSRLNSRLFHFGFRVESDGPQHFKILRAGSEVRTNLSWLGQLSVRPDGQDFFFTVVDGYNSAAYLVRPDGLHSLESVNLLTFDLVFPVYAGSDRISLAYDYEKIPRPTGSPALLQILKNERVIETLSVSGANPAHGPARGLWSWKNHWYLELPGLVYEDGALLNDRLGYPEMFTWRLLKERPFYFYRKAGQVHAEYDEQPLPLAYDEVLTEPLYGSRMLVQMRSYESGLVFFARRGQTWYFVTFAAK